MGVRIASGMLIALVACAAHHAPDEPESCRDPSLDRALFQRLQGDWIVAHAEFSRGQKPPTKLPIGQLTLMNCRWRFVAAPDVDLDDARDDLPIIDVGEGAIEFAPPRQTAGEGHQRPIAALRLHTGARDPDRPSMWVVEVYERDQEGEYLFFVPVVELDALRWEVSRGTYRLTPGEYVPGSDPDERVPGGPKQSDESR